MAGKANALERELREMSLSDELTGLYNRRGFLLLGGQALRDARRAGRPVSVLFFDADVYRISLSVGQVTSDPQGEESLIELLDRADAAMYQTKRQRCAVRQTGVAAQEAGSANDALGRD